MRKSTSSPASPLLFLQLVPRPRPARASTRPRRIDTTPLANCLQTLALNQPERFPAVLHNMQLVASDTSPDFQRAITLMLEPSTGWSAKKKRQLPITPAMAACQFCHESLLRKQG